MKKSSIAAIILFSALMGACTPKEGTQKLTEPAKTTETVQNEITLEPEKKQELSTEKETVSKQDESSKGNGQKTSIDLSDELFSYQIQIDNDVYTFPMTYQEFSDKGWSFSGDMTEKLLSSHYLGSRIWKNGDFECYTSIINLDKNEQPISDCFIAGINLNNSQLKKAGLSFILPKNIQYAVSTEEQVLSAYGDPDRQTDDSFTYQEKNYSEVTVWIDAETGLVNGVKVQNMVD